MTTPLQYGSVQIDIVQLPEGTLILADNYMPKQPITIQLSINLKQHQP